MPEAECYKNVTKGVFGIALIEMALQMIIKLKYMKVG